MKRSRTTGSRKAPGRPAARPPASTAPAAADAVPKGAADARSPASTAPPVVSLVGKSNSGKTTLMEKLLPEFVRRGYKVGTIKHHSHAGFDIDVEGKDSWRHKKAGARQVIIAAPDKIALVRDADREASVGELAAEFGRGLDLILTEGYKREVFPKIEVFRKGVHESLLCGPGDGLIALATDADVDAGVPRFGLDDARGIVDLVESTLLKGKTP
ncbi:MAG: molybdopterin-guanine dinucleotide biosynthesis protein B [Elusimicrobia bacterium]|nr:molybdopterin-guanine dinucleotide biosynthesis protein B [Elusimicrobiota bacterium]